MRGQLTQLPPWVKVAILMLVDGVVLPLAFWSAFALRYGSLWPAAFVEYFELLLLSAPIICIPLFAWFGLYRVVIRFLNLRVLLPVAQGVTVSVLAMIAVALMLQADGVPRSVFPIYWVLAILYVLATRYAARRLLRGAERDGLTSERVAIYGAGEAGRQLVAALNSGKHMRPIFYLDDDHRLQGRDVYGLRVHPPAQLDRLIARHSITRILLAIPSASRSRRREILQKLEPYPIQVMVMPGVDEIASGRARVDELRVVDIEDLLGRDSVPPNEALVSECIEGHSVMVTGAGGSIGSELCREIVKRTPAKLILFELSEYSLYDIDRELEQLKKHHRLKVEIVPILGNVQDKKRLADVMRSSQIDTIFHAAAYKHVPLVEHNPAEGIRNNVFGTLNTALAATEAGVQRFVLISTDKAVRPTNIMGASKRVAELIIQALAAEYPDRRFCMVRFGNVLGSSGSVVPLFQEQIQRGGPITVTDPEMVRYFMTTSEAAQLVIQAGAMGTNGEVFLLDMSEPVRIHDMAVRMIRLSGLTVKDKDNPEGDIEIAFTGSRPGEKLYEELLVDKNAESTQHPHIYKAKEASISWQELQKTLDKLDDAVEQNDKEILTSMLSELVSGYQPSAKSLSASLVNVG